MYRSWCAIYRIKRKADNKDDYDDNQYIIVHVWVVKI